MALGKATEFSRQEASFHEKCIPGLRTATLKDWKQLVRSARQYFAWD